MSNFLKKIPVGTVRWDSNSYSSQVFNGTEWITIVSGMELSSIFNQEYLRQDNKQNLTDNYLEEQYTELKQLKEKYEQMRDKLKVFEILKQNDN